MSTPNPTRTFLLFYWILDVSQSSTSVEIEDYRSVDYLRKRILRDNPVGLANVDAADLLLWNVSIPVTKNLNESVSKCQFLSESALLEVDLLSDIFPPPKPLQRTLHIVLRSRRSSTLKRSSEDRPTDEGRKKRLKAFPRLLEELLQATAKIYERIYEVSGEPTQYSDPEEVFELPFPSINQIPPRFSLLDEGRFSYMGRVRFGEVWKAFSDVKGNSRQRRAVYLYGGKGYGKSYILSALACLLLRTGTRVVYIPDCRAWLFNPLTYLRKAIFFAFANPEPSFCEEILDCEDLDSLANFCVRYQADHEDQLCFIVDQLNALDPELVEQDVVPTADKDRLRRLLHRMSADNILITSASANHKTFQYMAGRDTGEEKIPLMGGMTSSEMSFWWKYHDFPAFSDADKARVEDLTGCIPLLLKPFVMHHEKTLESLEPRIWSDEALESVRRQTIGFANAKKLELQHPTAFRDNFVNLMRNCLLGVQIAGPGPYMDHRYFYVNADGNGSYSCGLARQAITEFLRTNAEESIFLGNEWYNTLIAFSHNPSVIGFTVEQIVISKLASSGLRSNFHLPAAPIFTFDNRTARLSIDKLATYYVPVRFNLKAIDLLFASIDAKKKTAHIVPIQITVAKQHKDSEAAFFADKATWLRGLEDFKVEMSFLWIHKGERGRKAVEKKLKELRGRTIEINPDYAVHWVDIGQIDVELSNTLKAITRE